MSRILTQSIEINCDLARVDYCITDQVMMHRWLNPMLVCQPVGEWSTQLGSRSRFIIKIPGWQPTLESKVVARETGLIVWEFDGFFQGCDRWECQPTQTGTNLINRFEFNIPNPLVSFGFDVFAANLTKQDMEAQLQRLKAIAESSD